MRRTLPPLNPLRSFEAAARHQSYTLAAQELNVTQMAVSRQVRVLEDYLEVSLFERGTRSVRLTDAGRALLPVLTDALDQIERGIATINKRGRRNALTVQVYTAFAQRWLIPRLIQFRDLYPHIEVNLRASDQPLNFERQNVDAAIISAPSPPEDYDHVLIADRELLPICAPSLLRGRALPLEPEALKKMTLLHSMARPESWPEWLEGAAITSVNANVGLRFETASMVLGAAVAGLGIAIGTRMLVEDELQSGVLVAPFPYVHNSERKYYLVRPKAEPASDALQTFSRWLISESSAEERD